MTTPVVALTIAGSDSGGGAGIQADLKSFAAQGVYGATAITALTAQNTVGVHSVHVPPADFVVAQIDAVLEDLSVAAVKTGMLATAEIVRAVGHLAGSGRLANLVVDPVMVATSGDRLLDADAEATYVEALFPHARIITPNRREAEVLVGRSLPSVEAVIDAAKELHGSGPEAVVVTGGHGDDTEAIDVVYDGDQVHLLRAPRVATPNNHGTGCSFSAAAAARLALGDGVLDALTAAKQYVHGGLRGARRWRLGAGRSPIDHLGGLMPPTGQVTATQGRGSGMPR